MTRLSPSFKSRVINLPVVVVLVAGLTLAAVFSGCVSTMPPIETRPVVQVAPKVDVTAGGRSVEIPTMQSRPLYNGIALPYLEGRPLMPVARGGEAITGQVVLEVWLDIDEFGKVSQVTFDSKADSLYVKLFTPKLIDLLFVPGMKDSIATAMSIAARMHLPPKDWSPILELPVDHYRRVLFPDLYYASLSRLGFEWPRIEWFPSYNCNIRPGDTSESYPYLFYQIDLDSAGDVIGVTTVRSTYPPFEQQLASAILHAKFSPMMVNGVAVSTSCYLLVSFYPQVSYPTAPWSQELAAGESMLDQLRLHLLPDAVGLMAPAIPRRAWNGLATVGGTDGLAPGAFSVRTSIDASGKPTLNAMTRSSWAARRTLNSLGERLRFFPALDVSGNPFSWYGHTTIQHQYESTIRIWFDWLPLPILPEEPESTVTE